MSTNANYITAYLLFYLSKEIHDLDVWRSNRYNGPAIRAGGRIGRIDAGINGQADITGHWGSIEPNPDGLPGRVIARNRRVEIEVKGPGDTQSPAQKDFEARCRLHGTLYAICDIRKKDYVEQIRLESKKFASKQCSPHPTVLAVQVFIEMLRFHLINNVP